MGKEGTVLRTTSVAGGLFLCTPSYPKLQPEGCGELGWDAVRTPGYPEKVVNLLQVVYQSKKVI